MRSLIVTLVAIISLGISVPAAVKKTETVRVELNKRVTADRGRISIKFLAVLEDSRCPVDATCIWAGNAKIKISVAKGKSAPQILEINTLTEPAAQTLYRYEFKIIDLHPQKGEAEPRKSYVELSLTRK